MTQHHWCTPTNGTATQLNRSACRNHISDCHQRINADADRYSRSSAVGPPYTREIVSDRALTLAVSHTRRVTISTSCHHSEQTACDHRGRNWTNWAQHPEDHTTRQDDEAASRGRPCRRQLTDPAASERQDCRIWRSEACRHGLCKSCASQSWPSIERQQSSVANRELYLEIVICCRRIFMWINYYVGQLTCWQQ